MFRFHQHAGDIDSLGLFPTKLPVKRDKQLGQLDIPAICSFHFRRHGMGLSQGPQYVWLLGSRIPMSVHLISISTSIYLLPSPDVFPGFETSRRRIPLFTTLQCFPHAVCSWVYTQPHLVVRSLRFDVDESDGQAFSRD
jgi:hypothetical protein